MPAPVHKLTVRKEQTALFAEDSMKHFMQRLLQHVRRVFTVSVASFDDEALTDLLSALVEKGKSVIIEYEQDLVRFVDIQLFVQYYPQEVGDFAAMEGFLDNSAIPGGYRVDRVFGYLEQRFADIENGRPLKPFTSE